MSDSIAPKQVDVDKKEPEEARASDAWDFKKDVKDKNNFFKKKKKKAWNAPVKKVDEPSGAVNKFNPQEGKSKDEKNDEL